MVVGISTPCLCSITKVVGSNPTHGKLYSIQHNVIKFVLVTGQWFSPGTSVSSTNKIDSLNIAEILLKVVLNTITQVNPILFMQVHNAHTIYLHCISNKKMFLNHIKPCCKSDILYYLVYRNYI